MKHLLSHHSSELAAQHPANAVAVTEAPRGSGRTTTSVRGIGFACAISVASLLQASFALATPQEMPATAEPAPEAPPSIDPNEDSAPRFLTSSSIASASDPSVSVPDDRIGAWALAVDHAERWREALGHALDIAHRTGAPGAIALIVDEPGDMAHFAELEATLAHHDLHVAVWVMRPSALMFSAGGADTPAGAADAMPSLPFDRALSPAMFGGAPATAQTGSATKRPIDDAPGSPAAPQAMAPTTSRPATGPADATPTSASTPTPLAPPLPTPAPSTSDAPATSAAMPIAPMHPTPDAASEAAPAGADAAQITAESPRTPSGGAVPAAPGSRMSTSASRPSGSSALPAPTNAWRGRGIGDVLRPIVLTALFVLGVLFAIWLASRLLAALRAPRSTERIVEHHLASGLDAAPPRGLPTAGGAIASPSAESAPFVVGGASADGRNATGAARPTPLAIDRPPVPSSDLRSDPVVDVASFGAPIATSPGSTASAVLVPASGIRPSMPSAASRVAATAPDDMPEAEAIPTSSADTTDTNAPNEIETPMDHQPAAQREDRERRYRIGRHVVVREQYTSAQ